MWCCENCAIAEGCLLEVSWPMKNIRDVEVDTLNLLCHAAHALARDKSVLSSLWRKNQVDYDGGPRRSGHTLFFRPLNGQAHFLKSGRKNGTHFVYQWEVQEEQPTRKTKNKKQNSTKRTRTITKTKQKNKQNKENNENKENKIKNKNKNHNKNKQHKKK